MPQDYEIDFQQDVLDLDLPDTRDTDFTKPTELREVETLEFDIPAINQAITDGTDSSEDDQRRLITLHIASLTNQDPNKMNYDSAIQSYFDGNASDSSTAQIFTKLQGAIKPEIDADYTALTDFEAMTEEEQLSKAVTLSETDSAMMDLSMMAPSVTPADVEGMKKSSLEDQLKGMSQQEKRVAINKYRLDLLGKSRRARIETGEKELSPQARKFADMMSLGKEMTLTQYNQLSATDKQWIFNYTRAINPAVDEAVFSQFAQRGGQMLEDVASSNVATIERMTSGPKSPKRIYEKFMTSVDTAALDEFIDTGKWSSPEAEQQARSAARDIVRRLPEYRQMQKITRSMAATGGNQFDAYGKNNVEEQLVDNLLKDAKVKLYEGRELANQHRLDKAIKGATRKMFQSNVLTDVMVEGPVVMADMAIAIALGIPTAGAGTVAYSASRVYGDFVNDLVYEHNVDPDKAIAIGTVGTMVYTGIELAQLKTLTAPLNKVQSKFMASFTEGLPEFAKKIAQSKSKVMTGIRETASVFAIETSQESMQSITEKFMKAYAKEYAEAENVEYSELVGDWWDETLDSMTAMAFIAGSRGVGAAVAAPGKGSYDNLTMKDNINANPGGLDLNLVASDFSDMSPEIQEELAEAETDEDIEAILAENNISMTPQDYERFQNVGAEVELESEIQRDELTQNIQKKMDDTDVDYIDVNREVSKATKKASAQEFIAPMSEHVDLLEPTPGNYVIKSKVNDNSFQLEFGPVDPDVAGSYTAGKITLPENAKDFTFSHEMFHAMFDLGIINKDEQRELVQSAIRRVDTDSINARYKKKFADLKKEKLRDFERKGDIQGQVFIDDIAPQFNRALRDEEFMAHLIEKAVAIPNFTKDFSVKERTTWQKIIDFVKSLYSKKNREGIKRRNLNASILNQMQAKEGKSNAIIQSILSGEVMARKGPKSEISMDEVYASEYDSDIAAEYDRMRSMIEPDAAVEARLREDKEREEATLEQALSVPKIQNEAKIILSGHKFRFDEKFKDEVEKLSPAEKRRINEYKTSDESAQTSDLIFDDLVAANVFSDTDTITEMIEQLSKSDKAIKYSLADDVRYREEFEKIPSYILGKNKVNRIIITQDIAGEEARKITLTEDFFELDEDVEGISDDEIFMSPETEIFTDDVLVRGSGTDLYLKAFEAVKNNGTAYRSDTQLSDMSINMYNRLIEYGAPIKWSDEVDSYIISKDDLQNLDIASFRRKLNDIYAGKEGLKFSLAPDTDSEAFKNWFGDSKVVNEDGSPKVVYHGTNKPFTEFAKNFLGKSTKAKSAKQGFFFVDDYDTAGSYGEFAESQKIQKLIDKAAELEKKGQWFLAEKLTQRYEELSVDLDITVESRVMSTYVSIENPATMDAAGMQFMEIQDDINDLIQDAIDSGRDGVIIENLIDNADGSSEEATHYLVFEPTQIKSATENTGAFDPTNPDIRYSIPDANQKDLAAIALAGHQFEKGKKLSDEQVNKALDGYGVTDETERMETLRRADNILNELNESKADMTDHKEITQALIDANLNIEYQEGLKRIERESFKGGKTYEKAVSKLKEREKLARLADTQDLDGDTMAYLINEYQKSIITDEDVSRLLPSIEEAIRANMIKSGLITERNKKGFKSMPEYKSTLAKTLNHISNNLIRQITPGRRKTSLYDSSRRLKSLTTVKAIENNFNKLIGKIADSKVIDDKDTLLKRWNKIFKSAAVKEREKSTQELIHSKIKKDENGEITAISVHPMVRRELNLIKQVAKISKAEADKIRDDAFKFYNDPSDLEGQDADALFKDLEGRFPAFKKYNHLEPVDRAVIMGKAAAEFGGIKEKTNIELSDSLDSLMGMIGDSQKVIENLINAKNEKAQPRRDAIANLKGKRRGHWGQKFDRFLSSSFGMRSFFQDIQRQAPDAAAKEAKKHLDEMLSDWNDAIHTRDVAIMKTHSGFGEAVKRIFGVSDDWAVLKEMNTKEEIYAHLSKFGDKISKFQVMQLYASAVQQDYLDNAIKNDRQAGKYEKYLTPQDKEMIQWFRDYYAKERGALSAQMEKMTGVPIEMIDPFYVPVKIESNQAGLGTEINATAIIPPGMVKRVDHNLDFDESVGMFEIWARKVEENEHFKHTADTAVEMRSVFSTKPVHDALEFNSGKSYKNAFMTMVKDNINNGGPSAFDMKAIDTIRGAWTASKFALNARIGIKQVTSIPAFGLEIGLVDTAKHVKSFWTPEGFKAVEELWNSDLRKERWGSGNTEAINNAIGGMGSHTTLSKWIKRSMIFNNLGDMAPTLMVGQGIYRSYTQTYYEQGASMEEAKQRALSKTFQIVESTQQSSKLKDMAEWQRRGGSLGKMAAQFTNTTRQFLERDFTDVRAFLADPKNKSRQKKAANTVFINHVLLPGAYNGMNMLINLMMGDDIDEEDWWLMFASMVSGPFSGFIVFGSMLTGAIETGITGRAPWGNKSLTPFAGIKDDLNNVVLATEGILTTDWEQFDEAFTKLMKSLFAPYREVSKVIKNN